MEPTLRDGDVLLVRHGSGVRPGDIVVAQLPGGVLAVKRATMRLPEGWWLERDNPLHGVDSALVGAVPEPAVQAVAIARIWPRPRPLGSTPTPPPPAPPASDMPESASG